jgi:hypothetical protein
VAETVKDYIINNINCKLLQMKVSHLEALNIFLSEFTPLPHPGTTHNALQTTPPPHPGTTHNALQTTPKKERKRPGVVFPDTQEEVDKLKVSVFDDGFWKWYNAKRYNFDVEAEWERFSLHGLSGERKKFKGNDLEKSTRLAFMKWLMTPYAKTELKRSNTVKSANKLSGPIAAKVKIAQGLKEKAMKESQAEDKHWYKLWSGYLDSAGISVFEVLKYVK